MLTKQKSMAKSLLALFLALMVGMSFTLMLSTDEVSAASFSTGKKVTSVKAVSSNYNAIKISWKKQAGASGYEVRRATSKGGKYRVVKTTKKTSCTDTGLTTGKTYYYKVRAYKGSGSAKKYGKYSKIVKAAPKLKKVTNLKAKGTEYDRVKLTWKKVAGAKKYQIYKKVGSTYKKVETVTGTTWTDRDVEENKTYKYKVRAQRTVNGKKKTGDFSAVKSGKTTIAFVQPVPDSEDLKGNMIAEKVGSYYIWVPEIIYNSKDETKNYTVVKCAKSLTGTAKVIAKVVQGSTVNLINGSVVTDGNTVYYLVASMGNGKKTVYQTTVKGDTPKKLTGLDPAPFVLCGCYNGKLYYVVYTNDDMDMDLYEYDIAKKTTKRKLKNAIKYLTPGLSYGKYIHLLNGDYTMLYNVDTGKKITLKDVDLDVFYNYASVIAGDTFYYAKETKSGSGIYSLKKYDINAKTTKTLAKNIKQTPFFIGRKAAYFETVTYDDGFTRSNIKKYTYATGKWTTVK